MNYNDNFLILAHENMEKIRKLPSDLLQVIFAFIPVPWLQLCNSSYHQQSQSRKTIHLIAWYRLRKRHAQATKNIRDFQKEYEHELSPRKDGARYLRQWDARRIFLEIRIKEFQLEASRLHHLLQQNAKHTKFSHHYLWTRWNKTKKF